MKKIIYVIAALSLFGTVWMAVAGSGRESTLLPPQEVKIMYPTEDHAYQVKDINNVVRFKILPDGGPVIINSSGNTVWGLEGATGKAVYPGKANYKFVDFDRRKSAGVSAYTLSTTWDHYLLNIPGQNYTYGMGSGLGTDKTLSGVSVYLPAGNAAMDGAVLTIENVTLPANIYYDTTTVNHVSGFCLVPANDAVRKTGVTDHLVVPWGYQGVTTGVTYSVASANAFLWQVGRGSGNTVKLMYRYVAASGGTWYAISDTSPWY